MGDLWIQVITKSSRDQETLAAALRPKILAEDVIGYQREIERNPADVALHDDLAMLYLQLGNAKEAVAPFAISATLAPDAAATHFNLGTALTLAGRTGEATAEFHRAFRSRDRGRASRSPAGPAGSVRNHAATTPGGVQAAENPLEQDATDYRLSTTDS